MDVGDGLGRWFVAVSCAALLTACSFGESAPAPTVTVTATPPTVTETVTATPAFPATDVIKVNAVDQQGQVRTGFDVDGDSPDADISADNCSEPSAAGVSPNTYACGASVYSADACWKVANGDLTCLYLPWERALSRRSIVGDLPDTPMPEASVPVGLQLEDGSRYRQRNGMSAGLAPEGFVDTHFCVSGPCNDDPDRVLAVLDDETGDSGVVNEDMMPGPLGSAC